jgi:CDP-glucose 4,6-dehydratase
MAIIRQEFWRGRPVLITGATGLLGGFMVRELLNLGANVVALVRDGVPGSELNRSRLIERITTVQGSVTDLGLFRRIMAEYSIQTVFHLAAQTLVGVAKQDPLGTLEANIQGSWVVLEAARLSKVAQVLVASSDKAYGDPIELPYREDMPLAGKYPYDVSKSCVDLIAAMYATTYGLPVGIVRCANLFGGGDLNFSRSIPGMIKAALLDEPFEIRSDGKFVRDFLYAEDATDAYLTMAEQLSVKPELYGQAFNFSMELRLTVLDLVDVVKKVIGRPDLEVIIRNIAANEVREQYASSEKARRVLDWVPKCGLEEGLRRTIAWYSAYLSAQMKTLAVA